MDLGASIGRSCVLPPRSVPLCMARARPRRRVELPSSPVGISSRPRDVLALGSGSTLTLKLDDLPVDVLAEVVRNLSLADVFNLRLSGFASHVDDAQRFLYENMQQRLCHFNVWSYMSAEDVKYHFQEYVQLKQGRPIDNDNGDGNGISSWPPSPVQMSLLGELNISRIDERFAYSVALNMHALKTLDLGSKSDDDVTGGFPLLTHLPHSLGACTQVKRVVIAFHHFNTVPEGVLRMEGLEELDLTDNGKLEQLPSQMGMRLPKLYLLEISGCPLSTLPTSLLQSMERTVDTTDDDNKQLLDLDQGIAVGHEQFPPNYLNLTISAHKFPRLRRYVHDDGWFLLRDQ